LVIKNLLEKSNHKTIEYLVVPDDMKVIGEKIGQLIENKEINLIITNGGTGLAKKIPQLKLSGHFLKES